MQPLKLGLDLDGVLADFYGLCFKRWHERGGILYDQRDLKQHELSRLVGRDLYSRMEAMFNEPGFFSDIEPYPGAIEHVNALLDAGYEIEVVTSPTSIFHPIANARVINGRVAAEKVDWVARHVPRLARNITITKNKQLVKVDALVDDAAHNILSWAAAHPSGLAIVIEQPWNETLELPKNAVRCQLSQVEGVLLLQKGGVV